MVFLPRPELGLVILVAAAHEHLGSRLVAGGPNGRERSQQQGLVAVRGHHEGRADRRLSGVVEGVHEPDRRRNLLQQVVERAALGGDLLQRLELALDLALGVFALGGDGVEGALELLVELVDEVGDPLLVLVEAVLVVGVQDGAAEGRSQ